MSMILHIYDCMLFVKLTFDNFFPNNKHASKYTSYIQLFTNELNGKICLIH